MSQAPTKVFALTEFGSGDPSSPDRSYDVNRLKSDIQSALPRTVYANFWSGWGPNLQPNGKAAMSDPFWINKSQVSCRRRRGYPQTSPGARRPTPITFGTGPDSLVFQISEDAYANGDGTSDAKGDATFTVSVDGKQIGGTFTAVASHAAGQEQDRHAQRLLRARHTFRLGQLPERCLRRHAGHRSQPLCQLGHLQRGEYQPGRILCRARAPRGSPSAGALLNSPRHRRTRSC